MSMLKRRRIKSWSQRLAEETAPGIATSASKPASAGQSWEGISDTMATKSTALKCTTVGLMNAFIAARSFSVKTLVPIETATNMRPTKVAAAVPIKRSKSCQASRWSALANVERNEWGGFWFQQNGNRSNVSWDGGSGGSGAAAGSSSGCECDDAVLRIGDPRTSGYRLLSGGIRRLPAASTLVSA